MKRLLLLAAFTGLLGSAAFAAPGDDKDKKAKKECCKKGDKACAGEKKEGCANGEVKSCCKKKAEASAETKSSNEQK